MTFRCTQAEQALASDEVPVGCVFVHKDEIIGRGMNDTNRSLNVCLVYKSYRILFLAMCRFDKP